MKHYKVCYSLLFAHLEYLFIQFWKSSGSFLAKREIKIIGEGAREIYIYNYAPISVDPIYKNVPRSACAQLQCQDLRVESMSPFA